MLDYNKVKNIKRIKELVNDLNYCRDMYYNKNKSIIEDSVYDKYFDELYLLEKSTGFILSNSPTQTVGYEVKSELKKVKHNHPMLSLDKTKDVKEIKKFMGDNEIIMSCKMDGLTISLKYNNGKLVSAETRGNGEVGEDVLHTIKTFNNIPFEIAYKGTLIVDGEAIITYDDFNEINKNLNDDDKYKTPRNLASGSVRQLDSSVTKKRNLKFIAWRLVNGSSMFFNSNLLFLHDLGFTVVPFLRFSKSDDIEHIIEHSIYSLKRQAKEFSYPIDGLVVTYNNIKYGDSLGMTGHHPKHSLAFKFEDDTYETVINDVEWTIGKTGQLTPTAVFEPVEIDGTIVSKASLHNVSIFNSFELSKGDVVEVYKANMIIPQVADNITRNKDNLFEVPTVCPICGSHVYISEGINDAKNACCSNDNCKGKLLSKLCVFVSKDAHDIRGLSEARLEQMIKAGLVNKPVDLFYLKKSDLMKLPRMGEKSADKLISEINGCKETTLSKFLYSLSIPLIGRTASKALEKFETVRAKEKNLNTALLSLLNDIFNVKLDFTCIEDFGEKMNNSLRSYFLLHDNEIYDLIYCLSFPYVLNDNEVENDSNKESLNGKKFCITGKLIIYKNRDELVQEIERCGGSVVSSVTKNTDYLITNDKKSGSSKNKKAIELGIPVISEEEFQNLKR